MDLNASTFLILLNKRGSSAGGSISAFRDTIQTPGESTISSYSSIEMIHTAKTVTFAYIRCLYIRKSQESRLCIAFHPVNCPLYIMMFTNEVHH